MRAQEQLRRERRRTLVVAREAKVSLKGF